jgi:hypothetical protein
VNPGFHLLVNEVFVLPGCYAALVTDVSAQRVSSIPCLLALETGTYRLFRKSVTVNIRSVITKKQFDFPSFNVNVVLQIDRTGLFIH